MTTPAMNPPRIPSDPPDVKEVKARWEGIVHAIGVLLGAVTDWIGMGVVAWWVNTGKLSGEVGLAAVVGLASGTIVAKMRGKAAGSTSAAIMTGPTAKVVAMFAGAASRHLGLLLAASAALSLLGCVSDLPSPVTARIAANKQAEAMNRLGPVLAAACAGEPQPAWCPDAFQAFSDIAASHKLEQDFLDVYGAAVSQ